MDADVARLDRMERTLRRDQRTLVATVGLAGVAAVTAFTYGGRHSQGPTRFDEITVERINVVERDGTVRLVISNNARSPGIVAHGHRLRPDGTRGAGIMFYNDEGAENGGLHFGGRRGQNGSVGAGAALAFDRYDQDQVVSLSYNEGSGTHTAGLSVIDRPSTPILPLAERVSAMTALPDGPEKLSARHALDSLSAIGAFGASRVFVGTSRSRTAMLNLADPHGKARLRLAVDSLGTARIEFLDASGNVVRQIPEEIPGPHLP